MKEYKARFAIRDLRCLKCGFLYETVTGDFNLESETLNHAEEIHADNKPRCKSSQLIIETFRYHVQQN